MTSFLTALYQLRENIYAVRQTASRAVADGNALEVLACLTALMTKLVCARNALLPAQALARTRAADSRALREQAIDHVRVVASALRGEMHEIALLFEQATVRFEGTDTAVFVQYIVECVVAVGDLSVESGVGSPSAFAAIARRKP